MKLPKLIRWKKINASTAARRSLGGADEMGYEEMSEPNMKLSRALLIVLVLHVVAVSGIIAFNTIKGRQGAFPTGKNSAVATAVPAASPAPAAANSAVAPVAKDDGKIARAVAVDNDTGKSYVVAKGDNPVKIAKKLKVSEDELLALNHIDDPRKLQIGQRLIVPVPKRNVKGKTGTKTP